MRGWAAHAWLPKGGFQENLRQAEIGGPGRQGLVTGIPLFSGRGTFQRVTGGESQFSQKREEA